MQITRQRFVRGGLALLALTAAGAALAQGKSAPIRIGVLTDLSGNYSDAAGRGAVLAAQMAVDEFRGAIGNRKVELLQADHQNKPDVGAAVARRWFDQDGVGAVFEMVSSSVALAVQDIARDKGRISVATGAATSALTGPACSPLGMHWVYDTYSLANSTARELLRQGGDSWFFITADYAFGHALEADATALIQKNGGKVVGSVRHPLGSMDFSSYRTPSISWATRWADRRHNGLPVTRRCMIASKACFLSPPFPRGDFRSMRTAPNFSPAPRAAWRSGVNARPA